MLLYVMIIYYVIFISFCLKHETFNSRKFSLPGIWDKIVEICKFQFNMATKPYYKYMGGNTNIKISLTYKYLTVADFDISCGIYVQHFYTNIGRISPRLGGSRNGP